jgi:hypothetical protein
MTLQPIKRIPVPTVAEYRQHADPRGLAAGLVLLEHGISPYDVPMRGDAFTEQGYLVIVGTDGTDLVSERRPWPDVQTWNALQPHLQQTIAYLEGRI